MTHFCTTVFINKVIHKLDFILMRMTNGHYINNPVGTANSFSFNKSSKQQKH